MKKIAIILCLLFVFGVESSLAGGIRLLERGNTRDSRKREREQDDYISDTAKDYYVPSVPTKSYTPKTTATVLEITKINPVPVFKPELNVAASVGPTTGPVAPVGPSFPPQVVQTDAARLAEIQRKEEAARLAEEKRKAEEKRLAEIKRQEEEVARLAEMKRQEAERMAEAARQAEAKRKAEEERLAEIKRQEEKAARLAEMQKQEAERMAEAARQAEAKRKAGEERLAKESTVATPPSIVVPPAMPTSILTPEEKATLEAMPLREDPIAPTPVVVPEVQTPKVELPEVKTIKVEPKAKPQRDVKKVPPAPKREAAPPLPVDSVKKDLEQYPSVPETPNLKDEDGRQLVLRIRFAESQTGLSPIVEEKIHKLVEAIKANEDKVLIVRAYAGGDKDEASIARRVSLSRAIEVRKFLISEGLDGMRISVRAMGNSYKEPPADRVDILEDVR